MEELDSPCCSENTPGSDQESLENSLEIQDSESKYQDSDNSSYQSDCSDFYSDSFHDSTKSLTSLENIDS